MESNRGDKRCGRHTEGTPHEARAAATHAPCAATPTHRWKREKKTGAAHKAPPHAHTARAVRRVGTPHGGCTHTRGGAAHTATQKQSNTNNKKE
ncbi:hypothetical protein TCDM_10253 [Trypanosoma cruzi Dm28c]|uniref:Uncharacterized protein n=1 Tax=Trypanosoma cruzi Dm28c TaxID=1416333 RepID=V5AN25_TRYCR|nr:hypothetical protein TCDM_10253 [Trypanosoma cruzi Dm28c]